MSSDIHKASGLEETLSEVPNMSNSHAGATQLGSFAWVFKMAHPISVLACSSVGPSSGLLLRMKVRCLSIVNLEKISCSNQYASTRNQASANPRNLNFRSSSTGALSVHQTSVNPALMKILSVGSRSIGWQPAVSQESREKSKSPVVACVFYPGWNCSYHLSTILLES